MAMISSNKYKHAHPNGAKTCSRTECYISREKPGDYWYFMRSSLSPHASVPKLALYAFAIWYVSVLSLVGVKRQTPFVNALAIMFLVGTLLNFNAFDAFKQAASSCPNTRDDASAGSLRRYIEVAWPGALRLYVVPYCVASYSGVASNNPNFAVIWPKPMKVWAPSLAASVLIPLAIYCKQKWAERMINEYENTITHDGGISIESTNERTALVKNSLRSFHETHFQHITCSTMRCLLLVVGRGQFKFGSVRLSSVGVLDFIPPIAFRPPLAPYALTFLPPDSD